MLGPKEDPRVDFVIDLHTTTANMGTSLIFNSEDPLVVGMAFYVQQQLPHAKLFMDPGERLSDTFLTSVGALQRVFGRGGMIAFTLYSSIDMS